MSNAVLRCFFACVLLLAATPLRAQEQVRIGVLAYRPKPATLAQWTPLATALNKAIPDYRFDVEVYDYKELQTAVAAHQVDFVLSDPSSYLLMSNLSGLSVPLVTLTNLELGQVVYSTGGVIFTRAGRGDITGLQDVRGKTVAVTSTESLGGYVMQAYELHHLGLSVTKDFQLLQTGIPYDNVVEAVLAKRADVGFVRAGVLEDLAREGKLDLDRISIINLQELPGFPVQVSTRLYPEWPLAALPQTDKDLKRKVVSFLLTIHTDRKLTQALQIHGFDIPSNYTSVEEALRELRMPPFDVVTTFNLGDVIQRYRWQLISAQAVVFLIMLLGFNLIRVNRRLKSERNLVLRQSKQLKESNTLLDSIINNIPIVIFLKHASNLRYKLLNRTAEDVLGHSRGELLGRNDYDLLPAHEASIAAQKDRDVLQQRGIVEMQEEYVDTPAGTRIFHTKKLALRDELGQAQYLLGISEDITEHLAAERQLQGLNADMAATLQAIPDLLFEIGQHGEYLKVWTRNTELLVAQKELLLGHTVGEMLPPDAANTVMSALREAEEKGFSRGHVIRLNLSQKDSWFELSISLRENKDGTGNRYIVISRDITERKQAETELQQANISLATLSAVNRSLVHATDEIKLLQAVCQTIVRQRGYLMAWVGYLEHDARKTLRPLAQVGLEDGYLRNADIVWADNERGRGPSGRAARSGQTQIAQNLLTDASMAPWREEALRRGFASCISLPLKHAGTVFGVLTIYAAQPDAFSQEETQLLQELANDLAFGVKSLHAHKERDAALVQLRATASELEKANAQVKEERERLVERVTERTAQLLQANKAKDSFLATMSHEIRTPLGGLLGMMEMLGLSQLNQEQTEMLHIAQSSGKRLLRIVDDILDWSKIEAGKLVLAPQTVSIRELLKEVAASYEQLASAKGLNLLLQVDDRISAAHQFDPLRMSQILNNFTSNAIKFTGHGNIEISARLVSQSDEREEVRFSVKDSGIGIDQEHLTRLFEHYEQASADTARMYGGTGLGLSICRSLAELMEGDISVESTLGLGSTFTFTLRLKVASAAAQRELQLRLAREESLEDPHNPNSLAADGKQFSVLVVDDHPVNRALLKQQLEQLGLHAEVAGYGIVALSLWWTGHFDLIITDCHMPEMDGYELTRSIREMEKHDERRRIPVIAWTANVLAEEKERCRAADMDDLMTKPTELADLRKMLQRWLGPAQMPDTAEAPPEATPLAAPAQAVLDFSVLKKITKNHAVQIELLQEFNMQNHSDIAALKSAMEAGNPSAAAHSAHRIKGACRMVGALELEAICTSIEQAAKSNDFAHVREAAAKLDTAAERLVQAIFRLTSGR